jgi:hypothetical protein
MLILSLFVRKLVKRAITGILADGQIAIVLSSLIHVFQITHFDETNFHASSNKAVV